MDKFRYVFLLILVVGATSHSFAVTTFSSELEITASKNLEDKWINKDSLLTTIEGIVKDGDTEPLVGVVIKIRDTQLATVSDADGRFRFVLPDNLDLKVITLYTEYYKSTGTDVVVDRTKPSYFVEMYVSTAKETESIGEMKGEKSKKWWQFWK